MLCLLFSQPVLAADEYEDFESGTEEWAAEKAKRAHDLAASDMIYQQEDFRALYYQNQQMIALLKDLRDGQKEMLRAMREKEREEI